jgi:hypothetical protein
VLEVVVEVPAMGRLDALGVKDDFAAHEFILSLRVLVGTVSALRSVDQKWIVRRMPVAAQIESFPTLCV